MKTFLPSTLSAALLALLTFSSTFTAAADQFKVVTIREAHSADLIKVGRDWRKDIPKRMLVTLRVSQDMPSFGLKIKAYFYDKDNKLVFTSPKPNPVWTKIPTGIGEVDLPAKLEVGKPFDVYFARPHELEAKKWKTMVVVFGNASEMTAKSRPAAVLEKLSFPEEALTKKEKE